MADEQNIKLDLGSECEHPNPVVFLTATQNPVKVWHARSIKRTGEHENLLRKEVIQPQIPLRLPCYDLMLIAGFRLDPLNANLQRTPTFPI